MERALYTYGLIAVATATFYGAYELVDWKDINASAWAAWVQAIGALIAIAVAFFVANNQTKFHLKMEEERRREQELRIYKSLDIFLMNVRGCLSNIEEQSFDELKNLRNTEAIRLREVRTMLNTFPILDISDQFIMTLFIAVRSSIPNILDQITNIQNICTYGEDFKVRSVQNIRNECESIQTHVTLTLECCDQFRMAG